MRIWSERIGPTEYFSGIATVCCLLPYAWQFPKHWPVSIAVTALGLLSFRHFVRRNDGELRREWLSFPSKIQLLCFVLFGALLFGNVVLVHLL